MSAPRREMDPKLLRRQKGFEHCRSASLRSPPLNPASLQEAFVLLQRYASLATMKKSRLAAALPTPFEHERRGGILAKDPLARCRLYSHVSAPCNWVFYLCSRSGGAAVLAAGTGPKVVGSWVLSRFLLTSLSKRAALDRL